jgi:hypothetical protein
MSIDKCVQDAVIKLSPQDFGNGQSNTSLDENECEIYVWPQTWSDMSCGFGGMSGQMITTKPTVVVIGPMQDACVYHGGKMAYKVNSVDEKFRKAVDNRNLPSTMET